MSYLLGIAGAAAPILLNAIILLIIAYRTAAD